MNELYRGQLRLRMNLFQPSVKLIAKERRGSRLIRRYEQARTPLDRLADHYGPRTLPQAAKELLALRRTVDSQARESSRGASDGLVFCIWCLGFLPTRGRDAPLTTHAPSAPTAHAEEGPQGSLFLPSTTMGVGKGPRFSSPRLLCGLRGACHPLPR